MEQIKHRSRVGGAYSADGEGRLMSDPWVVWKMDTSATLQLFKPQWQLWIGTILLCDFSLGNVNKYLYLPMDRVAMTHQRKDFQSLLWWTSGSTGVMGGPMGGRWFTKVEMIPRKLHLWKGHPSMGESCISEVPSLRHLPSNWHYQENLGWSLQRLGNCVWFLGLVSLSDQVFRSLSVDVSTLRK